MAADRYALIHVGYLADLLGVEGDGSLARSDVVGEALAELRVAENLLIRQHSRLMRREYADRQALESAALEGEDT